MEYHGVLTNIFTNILTNILTKILTLWMKLEDIHIYSHIFTADPTATARDWQNRPKPGSGGLSMEANASPSDWTTCQQKGAMLHMAKKHNQKKHCEST